MWPDNRSKYLPARPTMTPQRLVSLKQTLRMPKKGPMTEYVRSLARIEMIQYEMSGKQR